MEGLRATATAPITSAQVRGALERARERHRASAAAFAAVAVVAEVDTEVVTGVAVESSVAVPKARRRLARAANGAATVVLGLFVLGLGAIVGGRLLGFQPLVIRTGSMGTTAPVGSLVLTEMIDADDVQPGTIIVLHRGNDPQGVLHRVIERDDSSWPAIVRTQGDANDVADVDPYVLPERVLSPVVVVPHLGRPIAAATTPFGAFALIVIPATLLLAHRLLVLWSTPRTPRPRAATLGA